ncbi:RNA polymerase sigma-70 factor [Arenibacter algicola]|uniref:RNA polymerase sigma factor n=1 Tax=Arenibacter algicola TaxID=616991 RepID=UPI001C07EC44|nr:RNA polymerase sigma-70 factor [Arenibacter algicola]MBU2906709.1 RNA polymerase sigma-70 factor [Arenibacter algicola]|tara:strand:+ start:712 stop:1293 length:582 start_codon:yes stop_codon:yes gene_type:complete
MTNTELIRGIKRGDSKAYSFLVDNYHNMLCSYAYGLINDRALAKDIVQNVFINVWRMRLKLKDDFAVKSYLYRSVYNEFVNQNRGIKFVVPLDKKNIDALTEIEEEEDENSLEKLIAMVRREIESLPPKCRQVFLLSKQDGLNNVEIAEYLDVSIKSVEAHMTKAFAILRKTLDGKMNGVFLLLFGMDLNKEV